MKGQIDALRDYVNKNQKHLSKTTLRSMEGDFRLRFTHQSTKIEGNTLTPNEVKTVLEDGFSVAGKSLREIYEVTNHDRAYQYCLKAVASSRSLDEDLIKDIHQIIMTNIAVGGIYRDCNVRITGASHRPPDWTVVRDEMRFFMADKEEKKKDLHPVSYAAWIHAEFVRIHPFVDGNGRTARMLLNFALLEERHKPIVIDSKDRASYYDALDAYGMSRDLAPFDRFVSELELATLADYRAEIQRALLSREQEAR